MKNLIEIARIVARRKVKQLEVFDASYLTQKDNKFNLFYQALATNKLKNDRDAATLLYDSSPTDARYRQLKSRFRKRLLNTLFLLDLPSGNASRYERAFYACNKDWNLVKILLDNQAPNAAAHLARQCLNNALGFQFSEIILHCSRVLLHQSAETGNTKDFEYYQQLITTHGPLLKAEIEAETLYQEFKLLYSIHKSPASPPSTHIEEIQKKLQDLSIRYESTHVRYYYYLSKILFLEAGGNYAQLLLVCEQAETYFTQHLDHFPEDKLIILFTRKMAAYLYLKDYKNGKNTAEKYLVHFSEGSDNWFIFMEFYFLLAMHNRQYIQASAILEKARQHPKFKRYELAARQTWKVFEYSMLYITVRLGSEFPVLAQKSKNQSKVNTLLEEPDIYRKENKYSTSSLLLLKILFLIDRHSLLKAQELIENLKENAAKYLKAEEDFRILQFIRLLQQAAKANFQVSELKNEDKYLEGLQGNPYRYQDMHPCAEVIPYEHLWKLVQLQLK